MTRRCTRFNGTRLAGWYEYDDEGVPAAKVEVIKNGILRNFLMSRMPIAGFDHSNGHGRSQAGFMPVGRQGNLIVSSTHTVKDSELRQKLLDEVKKQGKPYGLYFEDIQGGFTLDSTFSAAGLRGAARDGVAGVRRWPARRVGAGREYCGHSVGGDEPHPGYRRYFCRSLTVCAARSPAALRFPRPRRRFCFLKLKCRSGRIPTSACRSCRRRDLSMRPRRRPR